MRRIASFLIMYYPLVKFNTLVFGFLILGYQISFAQYRTHSDMLSDYETSIDMMNHHLYFPATERLNHLYDNINKELNTISTYNEELKLLQKEAVYQEVYALKILEEPHAYNQLLALIKENAHTAKTSNTNLMLARYYYKEKAFEKAISTFKKIDPLSLSSAESNEVSFAMAYAYFELKQYDDAIRLFSKLRTEPSPFQEACLYYYSYICYTRRDFDSAIESFEKLQSSKNYADIYSYFKAALYYLNEDFDAVIGYIKPILDEDKTQYTSALIKLLASSYFSKNKFKLATVYFQKYIKDYGRDNFTMQNTYQLGYSLHQEQEYQKSITELKNLSDDQGEYGQWGLLTLADSYIKTNNKASANEMFLKAITHPLNNFKLRELASLSYIKTACELGNFTTAIEFSKNFLTDYSFSIKTNEVKYLLSLSYLCTQNYQNAIDVLESMEERDDEANLAYQKATYYRGLEFYKERAFENAISAFMRSARYPIDDKLYALSLYWKSEAMYEVNKFGESVEAIEQFIGVSSAKSTSVYINAYYALGYAAFKNKEFTKSIRYFDKYINGKNKGQIDLNRLYDAQLRLADAYFSNKDYTRALLTYTKIEQKNIESSDYALFQKGIIYGLQNRISEKIASHKLLIQRFPNSLYADDANFEIAYSYFLKGDNKTARIELETMATRYPESPYVPKALITVGMSYYNDNQDTDALMVLKRLIKYHPSTDEAPQALKTIENIYIGNGNSDEFFDYIKDIPMAKYSIEDQDNITFLAISNRYQKEDYQGTVNAITAYIVKYPNAIHLKEAKFIRAESYVAIHQELDAVQDYNDIVTDWTTKYTRQSLLALCKIYLERKQYNDAIPYLKKLELVSDDRKEDFEYAIYGLLDAYHFTAKQEETLHYAQVVSSYAQVPQEKKYFASFAMGKVLALRGDSVAASKEYSIASLSKSEFAAEAKYHLATFAYYRKNIEECQKIIFEINTKFAQYQYWLAKAYILLADTYVQLGDFYQARVTLQSIADNYQNTNDDIYTSVKEKLLTIPNEDVTTNTAPNDIPTNVISNTTNINNEKKGIDATKPILTKGATTNTNNINKAQIEKKPAVNYSNTTKSPRN